MFRVIVNHICMFDRSRWYESGFCCPHVKHKRAIIDLPSLNGNFAVLLMHSLADHFPHIGMKDLETYQLLQ